MKKIFLGLCFLSSISVSVNAQGFLKKIKDKASEATQAINDAAAVGTGELPTKPSKKAQEEFEADALNTVVDKIPITKDKYNIGGIYYAKDFMGMFDYDQNKQGNSIQKFHVAWDEKTLKLTLTNQYTANGANSKSLIVYGGFEDNGNEYKWDEKAKRNEVKVCDNIKMLRLPLFSGQERNLVYVPEPIEKNSNFEHGNKTLKKLNEGGKYIYQYEPGILIISSARYGSGCMDTKSGKYKTEEHEYKQNQYLGGMILYTADKKAKAQSITDADIANFIQKQNLAWQMRYEKNLDGQKEWDNAYTDAVNKAAEESNASSDGNNNTNSKQEGKTKTKFYGKLRNKSDESIEIVIHNASGSSKSITSVCARCTKSFQMEVGGKITTKSGQILIGRITADMADNETLIAN